MSEEKEAVQDTTESAEITPEDLYDDKEGNDEPEGEEEPAEESEKKEVESKEEESEKDVIPESYDLKMPEDSVLDDEFVKSVSERAKEAGLNNEEAQDLLDIEATAVNEYHNKLLKQVEETEAEWRKAAETDKEIGGDNFKENVETANRVLKKFGTNELSDMLKETGYGNHPEVVRFFTRIAKLMTNDSAIFPGNQPPKEKTAEELLYGED